MNKYIHRQIGHYRLIRPLGQGAFAEVFLGQHIHLNTLAAVKLLQTRLSNYDVERFRHEAQIIARLLHPNIIRVLDFGVENDIPFLIMDYAPNGTIRQRFPQGSILPLSDIVNYVNHIASALQYAHNERLIHRDVKPENLLLGRQQEILLSDFGIALPFSTFSKEITEIAGTASYMAPEQFKGYPHPASDQYALGIIVYEWLSGSRPFEGSLSQLAWMHVMEPPPPLHTKIPSLPPSVEHIIMTALAKEYHLRYPSITAFASAFTEACRPSYVPQINTKNASTASPLYLSPASDLQTMGTGPAEQRHANQSTLASVAPVIHSEQHTNLHHNKSTLSRRNLVRASIGFAALTAVGGTSWYALNKIEQLPHAQAPNNSVSTKAGATILTYTGHGYPVYAAAWSPDGKKIASAGQDKTVHIWDASTGHTERIYTRQGASENTVSWSPKQASIASGSSDMTVDVWQPTTGQIICHYTQHQDTIRSVAYSPDGNLIASSGDDNTIQVWEALTGKIITVYKHHTDHIWSLSWSPDGQYIVSGSVDKTAQIWKSTEANPKPIFVNKDHTKDVKSVSWSHNGQYIASVSDDRTVRVWEAMTTKHATLFIYRGHKDDLNAVAWSHDDAYVASGSGDYTIHIVDARTGNVKLQYIKHKLAVHSVQWSHDDQYIISASDDQTVQIWRTRDASI